MCVFVNPQFKLIQLEPAEIILNIISFEIKIGYLERLRCTGDDLEFVLFGYSLWKWTPVINYCMIMAFRISALLYSSDLKTLIGVDLSAWTAAFAPSLLCDPPRVFNSSRAPTLNKGRPGISSAMPPAPPPGVTADYSRTISSTIWSAIGKRWGFCRFDRDIMRHIRHDTDSEDIPGEL